MPPRKDDAAYLWDILTAVRVVIQFTAGRTLAEYESDLLLRSAVERQIEILGEAARRVSKDLQAVHPEIPWRPIQAQRHVLAHDYGEIKHDRIWRVAAQHIPALVTLLEPLVPLPPGEVTRFRDVTIPPHADGNKWTRILATTDQPIIRVLLCR